jgi:protein arginine kinase activator
MLCQNCNKELATYHYKSTINGETQEMHLCANCASELGYSPLFNWSPVDFGFNIDNFLSHMVSNDASILRQEQAKTCPLCGSKPQDISRTGRVGCAKCYTTFANLLKPFIMRIHGNTTHSGKIPVGAGGLIRARRKLENLRAEIKKAIDAEDYEQAVVLRNEIRKLEEELKNE